MVDLQCPNGSQSHHLQSTSYRDLIFRFNVTEDQNCLLQKSPTLTFPKHLTPFEVKLVKQTSLLWG